MLISGYLKLQILLILAMGLCSCGGVMPLVSGKLSVDSELLDQNLVYGEAVSIAVHVKNNTGTDVYMGEYNLFIEDSRSNSIINEVKHVRYSRFSENCDLLSSGGTADLVVFLPDIDQIDRARHYGGDLKISLNKFSHCTTDCLASKSKINLNEVEYSDLQLEKDALNQLRDLDLDYILKSSINRRNDLSEKSLSELLTFCRKHRSSQLYYYGIYELLNQICHQSSINLKLSAIREEIAYYQNEYLPTIIIARKLRGEIMQSDFEALYTVNCIE